MKINGMIAIHVVEKPTMRRWSIVFSALAILLSDIMCLVVGSAYTGMSWAIKYEGYSATAWVSLLYAIPFAVAIIACVLLAVYFKKVK